MRRPLPARQILGVAPMGRYLGLAVVGCDHLLAFTVPKIGVLASPVQVRKALFESRVHRQLALYHVAEIAYVHPKRARLELLGWTDEIAITQGLALTKLTRDELRKGAGGTYRLLHADLLSTYPELAARMKLRAEVPGHRGLTTSRELPTWALALAVAGALRAADLRRIRNSATESLTLHDPYAPFPPTHRA